MNTANGAIRKETSLLLEWYDANARDLPWRAPPGRMSPGSNIFADPYHVWLSEIMLQQTQVATVMGYYEKFLLLWPTLADMAAAETEDILKAWAGLGYYSRARNLKKCADLVITDYGGRFPTSASELIKLPGIGPYTSAAIAAIAFGESVAVVDGNVERVISRYHAINIPLPAAKTSIGQLTGKLVPATRPGDFAQALMDLGATICTPKIPKCAICPWQDGCKAKRYSIQTKYPVKAARKKIPVRTGAAFVAINSSGEILLRKRAQKGMLAGMSEVPTSDWSAQQNGKSGPDGAPFCADWIHVGEIKHAFTHFRLKLNVYYCQLVEDIHTNGWWVHRDNVMEEALPELMKKAIRIAMQER